MIDLLLEPLSYAFMQRALLIALVVGSVCAVFSCFLVLKGWSLMGDAVSHAVLPGVVLSYLVGLPLVMGAFVTGLLCALGTGYFKVRTPLKEDAIMGILFTALFALGLVMISTIESDIHLTHILFGNILGLSWADIWETILIGVPVFILLILKRKDLMVYCFDPAQAKALGLGFGLLHYGLLIALALTIVSSVKAAGIILVIAMLITPGGTALLLTNRFDHMILISLALSVVSCITGTYLSFFIDVATAPLIVVMQAALFMMALVISPKAVFFSRKA